MISNRIGNNLFQQIEKTQFSVRFCSVKRDSFPSKISKAASFENISGKKGCGKNEYFKKAGCINHCPETCKQVTSGQIRPCTMICRIATDGGYCECNEGFVRATDMNSPCVAKSECKK
ncbi:hypothetical protein B4U79_17898 [Dinothrombium tinctorium]|uniref:TIL domain-containing protein n=1 Tax=Dinothrombium tinctorium TaxID=1965070 RepID=A0A3S3QY38_9ACAR|nr:hypothetical protein B4U79_17898 [Dinothrombium tinctorium]